MKIRYPVAPGRWGVLRPVVVAHEETKPVLIGSRPAPHWSLGDYWFETEAYCED